MAGRSSEVTALAFVAAIAVAVSGIVVLAEHGARGHPSARAMETRPDAQPAHRHGETAVTFLRSVIRLLAANRYARAWSTLDPRQQRLVGRDAYTRCESLSRIPGNLRSIDPLRARAEKVVVPGAGRGAQPSTAVTFRLTFAQRGSQNPVVVRVRAHALRAGGRWAWMLPTPRLALHQSGHCGVTPYDPTL